MLAGDRAAWTADRRVDLDAISFAAVLVEGGLLTLFEAIQVLRRSGSYAPTTL